MNDLVNCWEPELELLVEKRLFDSASVCLSLGEEYSFNTSNRSVRDPPSRSIMLQA